MKRKERLSVSADADLLAAAERAVARHEAASVSAWLSDAMRTKLRHEERLAALKTFIADYEAEHGVIKPAEIKRAVRRARARAIVVRGRRERRARASCSMRARWWPRCAEIGTRGR